MKIIFRTLIGAMFILAIAGLAQGVMEVLTIEPEALLFMSIFGFFGLVLAYITGSFLAVVLEVDDVL